MGIITVVTPGVKICRPVPRGNALPIDVMNLGKLDIHFLKLSITTALPLTCEELGEVHSEDPVRLLDVLWKVVWPIRSPRPGWSGFMQSVTKGEYPGQSSFTFMPMIDMKPTDMSCVYSTLRFVSKEAKRQTVQPVITFDQPLWWKAQIIIASEPENSDVRSLVIRLGAFHAQMSFLGCIGHIMKGSGLTELLETIYASNTVSHMLTGKAVARALRGHFLVDASLNAMLLSKALGFQLPLPVNIQNKLDILDKEEDSMKVIDADITKTSDESNRDLDADSPLTLQDPLCGDHQESVQVFDDLMDGFISAEEACSRQCFINVERSLADVKSSFASNRTARLWLQYMDMIDLLRQFIKAERTGNWFLHLQTLKSMLPYFASAGHNLYTKSVCLYLQLMLQLQDSKPDVHEYFMSGFHVIRRSDRFWAGLSSDLVIEQVLMRCMKTTGGLTRGRGMNESQRMQWLMSMPACTEVNQAMQEFTCTDFVTSDQHKDMSDARLKRDQTDTLKLLSFLHDRNPSSSDPTLRNISSGLAADGCTNADNAKEVGHSILMSMIGRNVVEYTFKKKSQIIPLCHKSFLKVDGEAIQVDPQLLFQRLVTAASSHDSVQNVEDIFKYELCSYPSSLFESTYLLRQPNKAALGDAIWNLVKDNNMSSLTEDNMTYVIDGGSLLQRIPWPKNETYDVICNIYLDYIKRKYNNVVVVFDGYVKGPTTKDMAHSRRGDCTAKVNFTRDMKLTLKKEIFLGNSVNKQSFIDMLSRKLCDNGINTLHADADADHLIAQTGIESATKQPTIVIGEDTDLLILLCHHAQNAGFGLYFKSEKKSLKQQRIWNIRETSKALGHVTCNLLPFIHAVSGCDTTSRMFGIGKGFVMNKVIAEAKLRFSAEVFCRQARKQEIEEAGEKIISCLYGGHLQEGLDQLRHRKFCEKVSTCISHVQVQCLPPSAAVAREHSARVYLQVQQWLGDNKLDPQDWGWELRDGRLVPKKTEQPAAPDYLLRVVRCSCKTDCETLRCSCKKHGLQCSSACGECRGVSCTNSVMFPGEENTEEI